MPTANEDEIVLMSVEEYETIPLIDLESMMQEACAERMNVSQTTVQRMYNDTRKKLASLNPLSIANYLTLKVATINYVMKLNLSTAMVDSGVTWMRSRCL